MSSLDKEKEETCVQFNLRLNDLVKLPIISGTKFNFRVDVKNQSSHKVEIPTGGTTQPQYHVSLPNGKEVTFFLTEGSSPEEEPTLVNIAPGETWSDYVSIELYVDITLPGLYEVYATLDWKEIHAKTNSLVFEVLPARFLAMEVSQGHDEEGGVGPEILLLQQSQKGPEEVVAFYKRKNPRCGLNMRGFEIGDLMRCCSLPDDVVKILAPRLNYEIDFHLFRWVICQTPSGINIGYDENRDRTIVCANYEILETLSPLAIRKPALFFFSILRNRKGSFSLAFARLDYPIDSEGFPIPESIPKTLQFKPIFELDDYIASSVALGPHALGSPMAVGLALRSEDLTGTEFIIMKVSHDGEIEAKKSFEIPGVTPLKAVTLNINTEGKLRVAFVVKEKKSDAIRLVKIIGTDDLAMVESPRTVFVADRLDPAAKLDLRSFEDHWGGAEPILLIRQPGKPAMVFDGGKEALYPLENDIPYDRPVELVLSSNGWNALVMYTDHVAVIEMMWF